VEIVMSKAPEIGCRHPPFDAPTPKLKRVALVQLIATVTLALCTLVVATAVSFGLARAEVAPTMNGAEAAPFAITPSPIDGAA
jgi:hypothetical protein